MSARTPHGPPPVTERQRQVARLVAEGMTNPQIAETLGITLDGAKHHVSQLLTRLDLERREEIAEWYRNESSMRRLSLLSLPVLLLGGGAAAVVTVIVIAGVIALRGDSDAAPVASTIPTVEATPTPTRDLPPSGVPTAEPDTFEITPEDLRAMNLVEAQLLAVAPAPDPGATQFGEQVIHDFATDKGRKRSAGSDIVGNYRWLDLSREDGGTFLEASSKVTLYLSPTHALAEFAELIEASEQVITSWEVVDPPGAPASGVWDDAVRINERAGSTIVLVRVGPVLGTVFVSRTDEVPTTEEATALARLLAERIRDRLTLLGAFED
jgi:DNA-binding CsgD family transcriptional regulator